MRRWLFVWLCWLPLCLWGQQYTGMSGLIHVPSADMSPAGEARIGGHFLHKDFVPHYEPYNWGTYNTGDYYLAITPFSWIELAYTCTLIKWNQSGDPEKPDKFTSKDRHFSVKVRPIKEAKWWPSVAVGSDDPFASAGIGNGNQFFGNYYLALSKHHNVKGHIFGAHIAYRWWVNDASKKWNGVVGGVTYQPSFQQNLRLIAEYTGNEFNVGLDWKLWKHFLLQASLQDGKYFSGGVCFCIQLL